MDAVVGAVVSGVDTADADEIGVVVIIGTFGRSGDVAMIRRATDDAFSVNDTVCDCVVTFNGSGTDATFESAINGVGDGVADFWVAIFGFIGEFAAATDVRYASLGVGDVMVGAGVVDGSVVTAAAAAT